MRSQNFFSNLLLQSIGAVRCIESADPIFLSFSHGERVSFSHSFLSTRKGSHGTQDEQCEQTADTAKGQLVEAWSVKGQGQGRQGVDTTQDTTEERR